MLMAMPHSSILLAEAGRLSVAEWNELEHVRVTRAFLNDPERFLRRLRE